MKIPYKNLHDTILMWNNGLIYDIENNPSHNIISNVESLIEELKNYIEDINNAKFEELITLKIR